MLLETVLTYLKEKSTRRKEKKIKRQILRRERLAQPKLWTIKETDTGFCLDLSLVDPTHLNFNKSKYLEYVSSLLRTDKFKYIKSEDTTSHIKIGNQNFLRIVHFDSFLILSDKPKKVKVVTKIEYIQQKR